MDLNDYEATIINIYNATAHPITMIGEYGETVTIPPSGTVARVNRVEKPHMKVQISSDTGAWTDITMFHAGTDGNITGLPDPEPGTIVVTSREACEAACDSGRTDVWALYGLVHATGEDGRRTVVGATGLAQPLPRP